MTSVLTRPLQRSQRLINHWCRRLIELATSWTTSLQLFAGWVLPHLFRFRCLWKGDPLGECEGRFSSCEACWCKSLASDRFEKDFQPIGDLVPADWWGVGVSTASPGKSGTPSFTPLVPGKESRLLNYATASSKIIMACFFTLAISVKYFLYSCHFPDVNSFLLFQ